MRIIAKVSMSVVFVNCILCAVADTEAFASDMISWKYADGPGGLAITGASIDSPSEGIELGFPREIDGRLVERIAQGAFQSNQCLVSVFIPSNIVSVGRRAFHSCTNLTMVVFEQGDAGLMINADAFACCVNLKTLGLKCRRMSIDAYAFANCFNVEEVELPDYCYNIDERSFLGCRNLLRIDLSHASSEWLSAFEGCNSLREIKVSEDNATYAIIDGMLVYKNKNNIIKYPPALSADIVELAFKPNVICPFAFETCRAKKIILHEGLKAIGSAAFYMCTNMLEIVVPSSVEFIDENAFIGCSNLATVVFNGDKLPELGENVFPPWVKFKGDRLTPEQVSILEKAKDKEPAK